MNSKKTLTTHLGWLVANVIYSNISQTPQVGFDALRQSCVARVLGGSEDGLEVAIDPVNVVVIKCKAHWVCQIPTDELPVTTIKANL